MSRYLPGDIVSRRKGLVMHRGLVLEDGRVLHNTPEHGEHVSSMAEFAAGQRVRVARRDFATRRESLSVAARGRRARRYHLLRNNCEHTIYRDARGRTRSPQLTGWALGLGLAGAGLLAVRHPAAGAAGFALGQRLARRMGRATRRAGTR
ncbi:MAG: hypothetical protein AAGI15_01775 [Pseudomonadota bacterium]